MQRLYYGGTIITMEDGNEGAEAILVEDSLIKYVGDFETAKQLSSNAELICLCGRTLMPGFIDGHGHFILAAVKALTVSLEDAGSFSDIVEILRKHITANKLTKNNVVLATGYDHTRLDEKQHPTKETINLASTEIPIYITHISLHMGCANDAALRFCGVDDSTPDPQGGIIFRVAGTSEPNGYMEETASFTIWKKFTQEIKKDMPMAFAAIQEIYLANGLTTVQEGGAADIEMIEEIKAFASKNLLTLDLVLYTSVKEHSRKQFISNPDYVNKYKNRLKLGGYKLLLDGSPQAKTAWLTEPYENSGSDCSYPLITDRQAFEHMKMAIDDNKQIHVHCNGDAASDQFINQYKKALNESENKNKHNLRPVMVHCQTVREDQLDDMVHLNMIPTIFVGHIYYWGDIHMQNLGPFRGNRISPVKSALDRGLIFNLHQDTPVTRPLMLHSVWSAVNRLSRSGQIIGPEQRIEVYDALKSVTINAAYMYFEEDMKGSLKEGKLADLIILDKNPLEVPSMEIKDIRVLETIKEGQTVWTDSP